MIHAQPNYYLLPFSVLI